MPYELDASLAAPSGTYNGAISASNDTIVVGSWQTNAANVYSKVGSNWEVEASLSADGTNELFGMSVALFGTTLAVGAPNAGGSYIGAVYLLRHNGTAWARTQVLTESTSNTNSLFGWHVALGGQRTLAVGSYGAYSFEGRVFAYRLDASGSAILGSKQVLRASDASPGAYFGWSLALAADGTALAVGAVRADGVRGRAYLFERVADEGGAAAALWNETTRLLDPQAHPGDRFGTSVALAAARRSGNATLTLVCGTKHKSIGGASHNGGAFLYVRDREGETPTNGSSTATAAAIFPAQGWSEPHLLVPPAGSGALNGGGVALEHDVLVIAPYAAGCNPMPGEICAAVPDHGRVYVYVGCNGHVVENASSPCTPHQTLRPPTDDGTLDGFGGSVALSALTGSGEDSANGGNTGVEDRPAFLVVGSPRAFGNGRVYVYRWSPPSPPARPPPPRPPLAPPSSPPPTPPPLAPPPTLSPQRSPPVLLASPPSAPSYSPPAADELAQAMAQAASAQSSLDPIAVAVSLGSLGGLLCLVASVLGYRRQRQRQLPPVQVDRTSSLGVGSTATSGTAVKVETI